MCCKIEHVDGRVCVVEAVWQPSRPWFNSSKCTWGSLLNDEWTRHPGERASRNISSTNSSSLAASAGMTWAASKAWKTPISEKGQISYSSLYWYSFLFIPNKALHEIDLNCECVLDGSIQPDRSEMGAVVAHKSHQCFVHVTTARVKALSKLRDACEIVLYYTTKKLSAARLTTNVTLGLSPMKGSSDYSSPMIHIHFENISAHINTYQHFCTYK